MPPGSNDPAKHLDGRMEEWKARGATENRPPLSCASTVVRLPDELLKQNGRGFPDIFATSALFAAIKPTKLKKSQRLEGQIVASFKGSSIRLTGWPFTQADLDLFLELVWLAVAQSSYLISLSVLELLERLGRETGGPQRERLYASLTRLDETVLCIEQDGNQVFNGSLVTEYRRSTRCKRGLQVHLNLEIVQLFPRAGWSTVILYQRHQLGQDWLAKWLHMFLSRHGNDVRAIKLETYWGISGVKTAELRSFRHRFRRAMKRVEEKTGWTLTLDDGDKLVVNKHPRNRCESVDN